MIGCLKLRRSIPERPLTEHKAKGVAEALRRQDMFDEVNVEPREGRRALNFNWDSQSWKKSTKILLGIVTILAVPLHRIVCSHCVFNDAFPAAGRKTFEPELRQTWICFNWITRSRTVTLNN
jgi:hypothetical protein